MTRYYNSTLISHRYFSVPQNLTRILRLTLILLIAVFTGSCEKGILKIGTDILPESDFVSIKSIDTLSVFSYTMFNDSIRTDLPLLSYLGQVFDPFFGTTDAAFVSQVRLNSKWDGKPFTLDSVKLFLHLGKAKGVTDAVHTLRISEIADQIYNDTAYYSSTPVNTTGFKITDIELPVLRSDTINDIELSLPGQGIEFGNYVLRDTTKLFYNNNIADFRSYFKGLYFQMDRSTDPLLISLSLVSDLQTYYNYFAIFCHGADTLSKVYYLLLDAKNTNASFNKFAHDFTTATRGDKMVHRNTTFKDTLSYLQSLNGVYTKVSLPGLETLKNDPSLGKIAINKARLVVPVFIDSTTFKFFATSFPQTLRLRYKTQDGKRFDVPDYSMASGLDVNHAFFDGRLDTIAKVYNFNIPAFVQAYLQDATGNIKPELEIFQGEGTLNAILRANKNKTPVKFEFTYTKF
jgi:hypothetical protein